MMKNWLLAVSGLSVRAAPTVPRRNGSELNSAFRSGSVDPPSPVPFGSPPCAMKPGIDAVEVQPVVEALADERLDPLDMLRRGVGPQHG